MEYDSSGNFIASMARRGPTLVLSSVMPMLVSSAHYDLVISRQNIILIRRYDTISPFTMLLGAIKYKYKNKPAVQPDIGNMFSCPN